jgi:hypothetical protein
MVQHQSKFALTVADGSARLTGVQQAIKNGVPLTMKPLVGTTVTRRDRPPSEHGVVTEIGKDTMTVHWHLKQEEGRGRAGLAVGKVYEEAEMLMADTPWPYCHRALS